MLTLGLTCQSMGASEVFKYENCFYFGVFYLLVLSLNCDIVGVLYNP